MGERESSRLYTAVGVEEVDTLLAPAKEGFMVANQAVVVEKVCVAMGQRDSPRNSQEISFPTEGLVLVILLQYTYGVLANTPHFVGHDCTLHGGKHFALFRRCHAIIVVLV